MLRVTYEVVCEGCGYRPDPITYQATATMATPLPPGPGVMTMITLGELHLCSACAIQARKAVLGESDKPWPGS